MVVALRWEGIGTRFHVEDHGGPAVKARPNGAYGDPTGA